MRNHKRQAIRGYKSPKAVKGRPSILVKSGEFQADDVQLTVLAIGGIVGWAPVWFRANGRLSLEQVTAYLAGLALAMVRVKSNTNSHINRSHHVFALTTGTLDWHRYLELGCAVSSHCPKIYRHGKRRFDMGRP